MDRRRALMVAIVLALLPAVIVAVISHLLHLPHIWPGVLVAAFWSPVCARQVYELLVSWGKR